MNKMVLQSRRPTGLYVRLLKTGGPCKSEHRIIRQCPFTSATRRAKN